MIKNKFGLSRYIPKEVKREIRQNSGFGCVICANPIVQYEHVNPEFWEAKEHDPNCMTLLCGSCHDKVSRGIWSKTKVQKSMRDPKAKTEGAVSELCDIGEGARSFMLANIEAIDCKEVLRINDQPIIWFEIPETTGSPFRLNALFHNKYGEKALEISNNIWKVGMDQWDVTVSGPNMKIWSKQDEAVTLQLRVEPPNRIIIEKINALYDGCKIYGDDKECKIITPYGSYLATSGITADGCKCAIEMKSDTLSVGVECRSVKAKKMVLKG